MDKRKIAERVKPIAALVGRALSALGIAKRFAGLAIDVVLISLFWATSGVSEVIVGILFFIIAVKRLST